MNRKPIESSNIKSVGYEALSEILEVEFQNGNVHQYLKVPAKHYTAMLASDSAGRYFHVHIRGAFASKKIQ